jgi:hypothetical protein
MALTPHVDTNIANYAFVMTNETGVIVRSTSVSGQVTNEDEVFDPATGDTIMYGAHFSNTFEVQITAVIAGNTGLMTAEITEEETLATSLALCGHVNNVGTTVTTGLTASQEIGQFKTLEYTAKHFAGIA